MQTHTVQSRLHVQAADCWQVHCACHYSAPAVCRCYCGMNALTPTALVKTHRCPDVVLKKHCRLFLFTSSFDFQVRFRTRLFFSFNHPAVSFPSQTSRPPHFGSCSAAASACAPYVLTCSTSGTSVPSSHTRQPRPEHHVCPPTRSFAPRFTSSSDATEHPRRRQGEEKKSCGL